MSTQGLDIIYTAIDELNAQSDDAPIAKDPDTRLFGADGGIDSLALVNLVVALEQNIEDKLGKTVVLVHEDVMAMENNPFNTVASLADYLDGVLAEA
ncbi:MAG: acyl carrier protein [Alphaproteobacteria bacterium]